MGPKILILGEVNSGKTKHTLDLLRFIRKDHGGEIAVLDFAPDLTGGVGGKIALPPEIAHTYYTASILPPRLSTEDPSRQWALARSNLEKIEGLFASYLQDPKEILVINDVTLYLHAGTLERLLRVLSRSVVAIVNGYYGAFLGESPLSREERDKMEKLAKHCDTVKRL